MNKITGNTSVAEIVKLLVDQWQPPGGNRFETNEFVVGTISAFRRRLCRPRAVAGAHRLRAQRRLSASWGHWFHRIDRVDAAWNRVVAHHERGEDGSHEIAYRVTPAAGTMSANYFGPLLAEKV
jgi:hypothetical protein